jgi:hypothetical protein
MGLISVFKSLIGVGPGDTQKIDKAALNKKLQRKAVLKSVLNRAKRALNEGAYSSPETAGTKVLWDNLKYLREAKEETVAEEARNALRVLRSPVHWRREAALQVTLKEIEKAINQL